MLLLKLKKMPWYMAWASASFAVAAVFTATLPLLAQLFISALIIAVAGMNYWLVQNNKFSALKISTDAQTALLRDQQGRLYDAQLQASTYKSRYVICLHWRLLNSSRKFTTMLCRWHYDADTWRQCHVALTMINFNSGTKK